ncbi:MAG: transcription antitermination factor NusB [Oscillospiraceae bacterium]
MDIARKIAVQALEKCEKSGYSNLILNHSLETSSLSQRDKGFVSILVYGTVERMYYLNYILQKFVTKPLARLDAPVRVILQSALYQCLFLDTVPNSAAINEAVTLTRAMGKTSAAGFVNAVLRKAAAVKTEDLTFKNEIEKTSILYSVSESLAKFFIDNFPLEYKEILSATLTKPKTVICVNTLKTTEENLVTALTKNGAVLEKETIQNAYAVQYKGDITKTDEFKNGHFYAWGKGGRQGD